METRRLRIWDLGALLVLSVLLLGSLAVVGQGGRERAKEAVCLANLHALGQAWIQYADDNEGKIVNGEAYAGGDGTCPTPTSGNHARERWWMGDDVSPSYMTGGTLALGVQIQAIRAGALFPYCGTENLYRCPNVVPDAVRAYPIVDAMNGLARTGTYSSFPPKGVKVGETVLWVKNRAEITVPGPESRLVFIDEGRPTPDSFATNYNVAQWWDPAPVRHSDGTNVSFADGHSEHWTWEAAEPIANGKEANPTHGRRPTTPEGLRDLQRVQKAVWGRLGY